MAYGVDLVIAYSADEKSIWNLDGKLLAKTKDDLSSFIEGRSILTDKRGIITGLYDSKGNFYAIDNCQVAYPNYSFSNGYLLVKKDGLFAFVDTVGNVKEKGFINAYPFVNGYALGNTYKNKDKFRNPYNLLLDKDLNEVVFSCDGKVFDKDDIDFISSVNDENIGIVVAKHKVYSFNGKDKKLTPVFINKNETNLKNQAKIGSDTPYMLLSNADSTYILDAKCGKEGDVIIRFNGMYVPTSIENADGRYIYKQKGTSNRYYTSPLTQTSDQGKWGLSWDSQVILPPQFDEILQCNGNTAIVRMSGKCGMLRALKDEGFRLTLNRGNDIAFRHQKLETTLRMDIPNTISSQNTKIIVDKSSGCEIDMTSAEMKDTKYGNYIQYNCTLTIPDSLPDEMYGDERNEIVYPVLVLYDGLKSPQILFKVKGWHYKYFSVDINTPETSVNRGDLSFSFDVKAERNIGELEYPISINIKTDSLRYNLEKLSEIRYKCKVYGLREGMNNIIIQILEQGCPPTSFPLEITYKKQSVRTRKENVEIKKISKPVPHIDI